MKQVTLISDGACVGNPGPGGWAYILRYAGHSVECAGGTSNTTTNNRMEITATIEGLKALKEPCEVLLISDSLYLLNGVLSWRFKWRDNGWMRKAKKGQERPVLNATCGRNSMRWLISIRFGASGSRVIQATQTTRGAMNWRKLKPPNTPTYPAGPTTFLESS